MPAVQLAQANGDEPFQRLPGQGSLRIAQQALGEGIGFYDPAGRIHDEHGFWRPLEQACRSDVHS
jgi:hypothetical protein